MRRGKGDALTGGSRDVNPQTMVMGPFTQSGNDANIATGVALPIPRLPIAKGRALVMELLDAEFYSPSSLYNANQVTYGAWAITTNPGPTLTPIGLFTDPRTIKFFERTTINIASATGVSFDTFENNRWFDLTDQAGHGILVATDQLYFVFLSANTATANTAAAKITYRFKDVALEEYIGIVQSQQ